MRPLRTNLSNLTHCFANKKAPTSYEVRAFETCSHQQLSVLAYDFCLRILLKEREKPFVKNQDHRTKDQGDHGHQFQKNVH